jgi:hypothetical protein
MELFVPSLVFLLVGVAIAYFVIPTLAPTLLIAGSAVVLAAALYLHYSRFGALEYEASTWQYNLKKYANWVILAAILLGAYGFYTMNAGTASAVLPAPMATAVSNNFSSPALPALATPPMIGGGMSAVFKTASSRLGELMRRGRINL